MKDRSCEQIDDKGITCGKPAFSWSTEHDNLVYCRSCYMKWTHEKNVVKARQLLDGLSLDEKKALISGLQERK